MLKQLEGARLGIFIFLGTVLLVLSIFLLGNKEKLFTTTIEIKSYFNQIEGLKPGAPVRLSGYDVGSISSISLSSDTTGRVEVKMRIDIKLKQFIRLDSQAAIETEGLVGKKIVTITPGSPDLSEISDGGIIKSKNPVNIAAIIEESQSIMSNIKLLSKEFADVFSKINQGEGSIGKLVNDDALYNSTVAITQTADTSLTLITKRMNEVSDIIVTTSTGIKNVITNIDNTISDVRGIISRVNKGEGVLGNLIADKPAADSLKSVIANLTRISTDARKATAGFAENMEALKHNWLFKGYFEQRGYWNTDEYEKLINARIEELKDLQQSLDVKRKELIELESKLEKKSN
jgi:phospholipid/cholesterol/gamma-HCH transport system substrate-binding protein